MANMKVLTCNLPEPFIEAMEKIVNEYGLYPSRSELIRVAIREFLKKNLKAPPPPSPVDVNSIFYEPPKTNTSNIDFRTIRSMHHPL